MEIEQYSLLKVSASNNCVNSNGMTILTCKSFVWTTLASGMRLNETFQTSWSHRPRQGRGVGGEYRYSLVVAAAVALLLKASTSEITLNWPRTWSMGAVVFSVISTGCPGSRST